MEIMVTVIVAGIAAFLAAYITFHVMVRHYEHMLDELSVEQTVKVSTLEVNLEVLKSRQPRLIVTRFDPTTGEISGREAFDNLQTGFQYIRDNQAVWTLSVSLVQAGFTMSTLTLKPVS